MCGSGRPAPRCPASADDAYSFCGRVHRGVARQPPGVYLSAMWGPFRSKGGETAADARGGADETGAVVVPGRSARWRSRLPLVTGALTAVAAVATMLVVVSQPRPDATLDQTGEP